MPHPFVDLRRCSPARITAITALLALLALPVEICRASCNQIPGTLNSFRGALGTLDRPFAGPGTFVTVRLSSKCDADSIGFGEAARDDVVSVVFKPVAGPRNVVVLAADCASMEAELGACAGRADVDRAVCVPHVEGERADVELVNPDGAARLRFRFPDTDALVTGDGDRIGLAGPATIAVSREGDPLPCDLAALSCAERPGLVACIDDLHRVDGECGPDADDLFPAFTALPPPNDYASLCVDPSALCRPSEGAALRLTIDGAGNALAPMDWRGVIDPDNLPIARLVRARLAVEGVPGSGQTLRVPGSAFVRSFSVEGGLLPPIFEPQVDPAGDRATTLFGSVDAPETVLRLARRSPTLAECRGGSENGRPCALDSECPNGECARASCRGGASDGRSCFADAECGGGECGPSLFDLRSLAVGGVGPIVLPRFGPGICQDSGEACSDDLGCAGSRCVRFRLTAEDRVPLDGLIELANAFVTVVPEAIDERDLNGDGDARDEVVLLADRRTGARVPIGEGAPGRATTRLRQAPFSYPALTSERDLVAFLEAEPLQGDADANGDGDRFDPILRVLRLDGQGAQNVTGTMTLTADAAALIDGRPVSISNGRVFFRTAEAATARQRIVRASVATDGTEANGPSQRPAISGDGRQVLFESQATNLVADEPGGTDTFLRDLGAGKTVRLRANGPIDALDGAPLRGARPSFDGRFVAATALAEAIPDQIVTIDRDGDGDGVFHEPDDLLTVHISGRPRGIIDGPSRFPAISPDGRFVAFLSETSQISGDPPEPHGSTNVFLHDRDLDGNGVFDDVEADDIALDVNNTGARATASLVFEPPAISADARISAFAHLDRNLPPLDFNDFCLNLVEPQPTCADIIVRDRLAPRTESASFSSAGEQANNHSITPALSADGRYVAFLSAATNLVPGDTNGVPDVFVRDRETATTTRVSVASGGEQADGGSLARTIGISADGRYVVFQSLAGNLASGDANESCDNDLDGTAGENCPDIFLHDRLTGFTRRVSESRAGGAGNGASFHPALSADAAVVAFESGASDLIEGDANAFCDVDRDGRPEENCSDVFVAEADPSDLARDLTGDGDLDDTVLRVLDVREPGAAPVVLGPATQVATIEGQAAFLAPERSLGADRNGDGDADDDVVHLWTGTAVRNLRRAASAIALSRDFVAALVPEAAQGRRDLDGDGDVLDTVLQVASVGEPDSWVDTGRAAARVAIDGSYVAFLAVEAEQGADLNGDGDRLDRVVGLFDAAARQLVPVERAVEDFVLGSDVLAFRTSEAAEGGRDLNGDGDTEDSVLEVYDLARRRIFGTGQAATPCRFVSCDPRLPYRPFGTTVKFLTFEGDQGADLTGNGDQVEVVLQTFDVERAAAEEESGGGAAIGGEGASTSRGVAVVGAVSTGVCTDSGLACAFDADCSAGATCHVPPGQCILDLATACDPALPTNTCGTARFCVPTSEPGVGTCHERQGACSSDVDCTSPARCRSGGGNLKGIVDPLAIGGGAELIVGSGRCVESIGVACLASSGDCPEGSFCGRAGTCERDHGGCRGDADCPGVARCRKTLVIAGAADRDGDGLADPLDNCPATANADQIDADADGIGDACSMSPPTATPTVEPAASQTPTRTAAAKAIAGDDDGCAIGTRARASELLAGLIALLALRRLRAYGDSKRSGRR